MSPVTPSEDARSIMINQVSWDIELPPHMVEYFDEKKQSSTTYSDRRKAIRLQARIRGVLYPERTLPAFPRPERHLGIYTNDFSRNSFSFLSAIQFWPTETIRILLPAFWMSGRVIRARYLGPHCYEAGCQLIRRHIPGED
jgi:hypothetical protein